LEESEKALMVLQDDKKSSSSSDVIDVSKNVAATATDYTQLGADIGEGIGIGPLNFKMGGALVGAGLGLYHGTTETIVHELDKTADNLKDLTEKTMDVGANIYENTRQGAQQVTEKVLDNFDVLGAGENIAKTLTSGIAHAEEAKAKADSDARIAEANAKAEVAKYEAQAKILEMQLELAKLNKK
jgi:hypothetical protein